VHWLSPEQDQLYNLDDDPFELSNRIDDPDSHAVRDKLATMLESRLEALGDDFMGRRTRDDRRHQE
jgi:hypothetical protein